MRIGIPKEIVTKFGVWVQDVLAGIGLLGYGLGGVVEAYEEVAHRLGVELA